MKARAFVGNYFTSGISQTLPGPNHPTLMPAYIYMALLVRIVTYFAHCSMSLTETNFITEMNISEVHRCEVTGDPSFKSTSLMPGFGGVYGIKKQGAVRHREMRLEGK